MRVLVLNAGSSSIKMKLFENKKVVLAGRVDNIGGETTTTFSGARIRKRFATHHEAIEFLFHNLSSVRIDAVVHRVVHGGEKYTKPVRLTQAVIDNLEKLVPLAPLHLPANIDGIRTAKELLPDAKHIGVFDTGFHRTMPPVAYRYGVDEEWYRKGVRRYGFHGTSHEFIARRARKMLGRSSVNVVSCHLGNGSSICAIRNNRSVDTSMGFSPLSGVMMGTRSGNLDPETIFFLQQDYSLKEIREHLEFESGFKGLMGTNDLREIHAKAERGHRRAQLTIDLFCYEIARFVGAYAAMMPHLDALVFTGGIGEEAWYVRRKIVEYLPLLGLKVDGRKNKANSLHIDAPTSSAHILVIPTDEEWMMAQKAKKLL